LNVRSTAIMIYHCPKHRGEILYREEEDEENDRPLDALTLTVPEMPATCRKCGVAYYKWECVTEDE
jgi:hypothetical protein